MVGPLSAAPRDGGPAVEATTLAAGWWFRGTHHRPASAAWCAPDGLEQWWFRDRAATVLMAQQRRRLVAPSPGTVHSHVAPVAQSHGEQPGDLARRHPAQLTLDRLSVKIRGTAPTQLGCVCSNSPATQPPRPRRCTSHQHDDRRARSPPRSSAVAGRRMRVHTQRSRVSQPRRAASSRASVNLEGDLRQLQPCVRLGRWDELREVYQSFITAVDRTEPAMRAPGSTTSRRRRRLRRHEDSSG